MSSAQPLRQEIEKEAVRLHAVGGLCANCLNERTCGIAASAGRAIHQCELHEVSSLPTLGASPRENEETAVPANETHLLGLCSNCDNRNGCKLPKPPSGVWRCEEYR